MPPQSTPEKNAFIHGLIVCGITPKEIAAWPGVGIAERTARRKMAEWKGTKAFDPSLYPAKPRSGAPRKLDARDERILIREIQKHPRRTWEDFGKQFGVSKSTVRSIANGRGYFMRVMRKKPFLSKRNVEAHKWWLKKRTTKKLKTALQFSCPA